MIMHVRRVLPIVVVLVGSTVSIAGQERTAASPFSQAAIQRAVTAAAAREVGPPAPESGQGLGDWSRVRRLSAGTEIVVAGILLSGPHEMLYADDAALTVLNADGVRASGRASTIRRLASEDARGLASVAEAGTIIRGDLRIATEGVTIAGRKVMDLRQLLVRIPKADVTEVRRATGVGRRSPGRVAAGVVVGYLGFAGGFIAGGLVGLKVAESAGTDPSNLGPMLVGVPVGMVTGVFAYRAVAGPRSQINDTLVYQAPVAESR